MTTWAEAHLRAPIPPATEREYVDCGLYLHEDMLFYDDEAGVPHVLTGPWQPPRFPKVTESVDSGQADRLGE